MADGSVDRDDTPVWRHRHDGVIGTTVELRLQADDEAVAAEADRAALAEIDRLVAVFSAYDPASDLCRWRRGEVAASSELTPLLATATRWWQRSGGVFDPSVGRLTRCWADAAAAGAVPGDDELATLVSMRTPPDVPSPDLTLNALAKGHLADRAAAAAMSVDGIRSVTVNAGGDLVHRGTGTIRVGVENPHRPYDNEPPLAVVTVCERGLATSGSARRGWRIGGRWFSHVIDPRTGRPVDHVASATVVAPDAATADAVATVLSVLAPDEGIAFVDSLADVPEVTALVVGADRMVWRSSGWRQLER
jgi:thiamine biosynthesis lipoprotein